MLRRAGAVASIDLASGQVRERRAVCAAPQGIAVDGEALYVTCAGGELVTLPTAAGGEASVFARLDRDLRDVVVQGDSLLVGRLRSAEVLRVGKADGAVRARSQPKFSKPFGREPFVGYRLVATPTGALLASQLASTAEIPDAPGSYGGNACEGAVTTTVATIDTSGEADALEASVGAWVGHAVLPVDLARAFDGGRVALIAAGNGHTEGLPQVHVLESDWEREFSCYNVGPGLPGMRVDVNDPPGQAVAVAFTPDSATLVVFTREPAGLHLRAADAPSGPWTSIALGGESREDTGHAVFHSNTGGGIACASCHPAGGEDGRVWRFSGIGARRTQGAPIVARAHPGASGVGPRRSGRRRARKGSVREPGRRVQRCHGGAKLTNDASVDVGTGGAFQVPSLLGLAVRAPYLHDGRATALADRLGLFGEGDRHGKTSSLTDSELHDLVTYLEAL